MRVLVACEFSGVVREAFAELGHDAWSCDLLPTEQPSQKHIRDDVRNHLKGWDLVIAHPPCTHLAVSGARWWKDKRVEQEAAIKFVQDIWWGVNCKTGIALENPIGILSTAWLPPSQIIHPRQFGHTDKKSTCLWLRNLPKLVPTDIVPKAQRVPRIHMMPDTKDRWKKRSITYSGIAKAMAIQWGGFCASSRKDNNNAKEVD